MRFREKLLILLVAVIVSALGFYLISSPFVGLHTMVKKTGNENIERYLSECDDDANQTRHITDRAFQFTRHSPSYCNSRVRHTIGAGK